MSDDSDDVQPGATHAGDDQLKLDLDCTCRQCGYNLRGLAVDGKCPECGEYIAESLKVQQYWGVDPHFLAQLGKGADRLMFATILYMLGPFAVLCVGCVFALAYPNENILLGLLVVWSLVVWFLWTSGIWKLTAKESNVKGAKDLRFLRYAARGLSLLGPILLGLRLIAPARSVVVPPFNVTYGLSLFAAVVLCYLAVACLPLIVRNLADRAGDQFLSTWATALSVVVPLIIACLILLLLPGQWWVHLGLREYSVVKALVIVTLCLHIIGLFVQFFLIGELRKHLQPDFLIRSDDFFVTDAVE